MGNGNEAQVNLFPSGFHCLQAMVYPGSAAAVSKIPIFVSTEGLPRREHYSTCRTRLASTGLEQAIEKGSHVLACTSDMTDFINGEMRQCVKDEFIILLPVADIVRVMGDKLKLSRIVLVPHEQNRPRLIPNLSKINEGTPSVNETMNRKAAPVSMQLRRSFPCIIQAIWEADIVKVPVQVSKLDFKNA